MPLVRPSQSSRHRSGRTLALMRDTAWLLVLAIVILFAFFAATGAFAPGEVWGLTGVVTVLFLAWCLHAWWQSKHTGPAAERDPEVVRARERRGF